jgi:hypothetical protein
MRPFVVALLVLAPVLVLTAAPAARKSDPMTAEAWRAAAAAFEGKTVKTSVLDLAEAGLINGEEPAAVKILTGNEKEEVGGEIIVLMPPARFQEFVATFSQRQTGPRRGNFGTVSKARVLNAVFVTLKGEGALLYGLDAKETKTLGKPSEILAAQLRPDRKPAEAAKPGWTTKEFNLARLGAAGAPESAREWERLQNLLSAQTQAARQPRWKNKELLEAVRGGTRVTIEDPAAKVAWTLVWK